MKIEEKIIKELMKSQVKSLADLEVFKRKISKKYKIPCPSNIELLKLYHKLVKNKTLLRQGFGGRGNKKMFASLEKLLRTRPIRSLSGIVNISVLTKPYPCPGKCLYCPIEEGIPKSYLSGEPAVERAKKLKFDPYLQVQKRIEMLRAEGHPADKIELRVVGGTWSYYPKKYQAWFVKRCFDACNENSKIKNQAFKESEGEDEGKSFIACQKSKLKIKIKNLKDSQKRNEKTKQKIVGLSIETRPDFINEKEIKWLRELGVTMVELGVQSIYDDVLKLNLRGHGVKETVLATKLLKDAGFKILYQMMPNLPGSDLKRDEKMFAELFQNPDFRPDLLKIYPCALLKEAPLYKLYKYGKYEPYTEKQLIELLTKIKKRIPYYVRIQRIARDIPSQRIINGGAKISNLRQIIMEKMREDSNLPSTLPQKRAPGWKCKCIRCREVREKYNPKEKIYLFRQDYEASDGREIFLSFENKNQTKLYSLLRLRIPSPLFDLTPVRPVLVFPVLEGAAIIREIHTYGELVPPHQKWWGAPQHRGLGKRLIKEAEKITKKEFSLNKIAVIAAIGARAYFQKVGYKLKETYMVKNL